MRKRKTIRVTEVVEQVNRWLRVSTCTPEMRKGMIAVLTHILHDTNTYAGFRYLTLDEMPKVDGYYKNETLPGIRGTADLPSEERFANTDDTRVQYFG